MPLEAPPTPPAITMSTGITMPTAAATIAVHQVPLLKHATLSHTRQLVLFEAEQCGACQQFKQDIAATWHATIPLARSEDFNVPDGWILDKPLFATPTLVLFEHGREVSRYTGYDGDRARFWAWLGEQLLSPEERKIAFEHGTERAFTGSLLDEKRTGTFIDPITGAALFRSETKFDSGSGWPSFFNPVEGAVTFHEDVSYGMRRIEVRSTSSGIHLGHVFDDGPPPTRKRYCINSRVLRFVPDA